MRRMTTGPGMAVLAMTLLGLVAVASPAAAQTKTAQGTVSAVSGSSLTLKIAGAADMTFVIDDKTTVEASGAGKETRSTGGVKVADYIKPGSNALVTYRVANGTNQATNIRRVSSPGGPAGPETKIAAGAAKAVSAGSLTISSGGKDMTFSVTKDTKVLGKGAGTATRAAGGTIAITSLVKAGDTVSVSYTEAGSAKTASEVRVTR